MDNNYTKSELDLKFQQIKLAMDEKHQENKETLRAIDSSIHVLCAKLTDNTEKVDKHIDDDKSFQDRAEPMLKVFKENEIFKMQLDKKTGTLTLYARRVLTIGALLAGIGAIIKYLLMK